MKTKKTVLIFALFIICLTSMFLVNTDIAVESDLLSANMEALTNGEFAGYEAGYVTDSKTVKTGEYQYIYGYLGGIYVPITKTVTCCRVSSPGSACNVAAIGRC